MGKIQIFSSTFIMWFERRSLTLEQQQLKMNGVDRGLAKTIVSK